MSGPEFEGWIPFVVDGELLGYAQGVNISAFQILEGCNLNWEDVAIFTLFHQFFDQYWGKFGVIIRHMVALLYNHVECFLAF